MTTRDMVTEILLTRQALAEYRGHPVTRDEVRSLSEVEAKALYVDRYIERPGFGMLLRRSAPNTWAERVINLLVDYGVHSGPANAIKALQRALGVSVDGVLGDQTTETFLLANHEHIYRLVFGDRLRHLSNIVTSDPTQATWLRGWVSRLLEFLP